MPRKRTPKPRNARELLFGNTREEEKLLNSMRPIENAFTKAARYMDKLEKVAYLSQKDIENTTRNRFVKAGKGTAADYYASKTDKYLSRLTKGLQEGKSRSEARGHTRDVIQKDPSQWTPRIKEKAQEYFKKNPFSASIEGFRKGSEKDKSEGYTNDITQRSIDNLTHKLDLINFKEAAGLISKTKAKEQRATVNGLRKDIEQSANLNPRNLNDIRKKQQIESRSKKRYAKLEKAGLISRDMEIDPYGAVFYHAA